MLKDAVPRSARLGWRLQRAELGHISPAWSSVDVVGKVSSCATCEPS